MMAHMVSAEELLAQAQLMESYGANCIYCTDSAGYMLPQDVTDRVGLLRDNLKSDTEIGFHGHHNLAMGVANSLAPSTPVLTVSTARRRDWGPVPVIRHLKPWPPCSSAWAR